LPTAIDTDLLVLILLARTTVDLDRSLEDPLPVPCRNGREQRMGNGANTEPVRLGIGWRREPPRSFWYRVNDPIQYVRS